MGTFRIVACGMTVAAMTLLGARPAAAGIVYVDNNYKVQSVATSRNSTDHYIGAYPKTLQASGATYGSFTVLTAAP